MIFLTILCTLLFEQFKPLRADSRLFVELHQMAMRVETWCNAGHHRHGRLGWLLIMASLIVPAVLISWLLGGIHPMMALAWNVLIVYFTLGFRRNSQYFRTIQIALVAGEEVTAQSNLSEWTGLDTRGMETQEMSRLTIEKALLVSHRQVFGLLFWFLLLPGPAGAVMYRVSEYLSRAWNEPEHLQGEVFGQFAAQAFYLIDWLPARVTAATFAIVGNFEDAVYAWRNFAKRWQDEVVGIILASGGGALGVRLGGPAEKAVKLLPADAIPEDLHDLDPEIMPGEEPTPRILQSMVGLVWRTLLLWMLLLLLLSIAI